MSKNMLKEDYELQAAEVQQLAGRDALAAFFARLGYDTNNRIVQTADALNLTADTLKPVVTHIERLASQDAGLFEVYLFELKSVTVKTTQNLVKNFRDRMGDYLLVLTDDFRRLDFVLVERYQGDANRTPGGTGPLSPNAARVSVRPRVLTVQRQNPDAVALRVLRRFSYTEPDTFAQYDKLISAYDVADWSKPYFNNRALFADYYLTERLPNQPEWVESDALRAAAKHLRELYEDVRDEFSNRKEAYVRQKLYEPVLTALGFRFEPGKASSSADHAPDYVLYSSELRATSSEPNRKQATAENRAESGQPLAVCLTYTWSRNLDGKDDGRDSETPDENPGATVVSLLESGVAPWAIVTNGKIWRLYSAKAHSRATNYYEIDLEETLAVESSQRGTALRFFWLFFRAAAFVPTAQTLDGETLSLSFLDLLLRNSERYAKELGERLKERVFEQIFPNFARGFITYARRHGGILPPDFDKLDDTARARALEPFFSGTLTFLYRLLFLFYAESRDLLPVREQRGYYARSLESIKRRLAEKAGTIRDEADGKLKAAYSDLTTDFYDALTTLFAAVDRGNPDLNVPVYNGGLFMTAPDAADMSAEGRAARFLATCKIPDRELALGLDLMARDLDDKSHGLVFIDYKSLGVRQLGSIYEGLLEFRLRIAPAEMALVKGKKTEEVVPYAEAVAKKLTILKVGRGKDAADKILPKGSVYLENDRRERKATGSYYTPDYIVKYIVENTVGPVLREKFDRLLPVFWEAEQALKAERQKYDALKKQGRTGDNPENQVYIKFKERLVEPFYEIRVLDPAMGSGHFLVEAVDFVTDRLADFLSRFGWNPVTHELTRTRQEIRLEMEAQGVSVDYSKLDDLNLLKRRVLKSCIYGVDLNPMAVELAKVSLWLDCFTLGAPLSFLDHHLKAGNSLLDIGRIEDYIVPESRRWNEVMDSLRTMVTISQSADITKKEVDSSRALFQEYMRHAQPIKERLNVELAAKYAGFGNVPVARVAQVANLEEAKRNDYDKAAYEKFLHSQQLATERRFFHWKIEFPEVFVDPALARWKANGGFDAIVGNPPYKVVEEKSLKSFLQNQYVTSQYQPDLYVLFTEHSIKKLRKEGYVGVIVPSTYIGMHYFSKLREFLLKSIRLDLVAKLTFPVFDDATVESSLIVGSKTDIMSATPPIEGKGYIFKSSQAVEARTLTPITFQNVNILKTKNFDFDFLSDLNLELTRKLESNSLSLSDISYITVGIKPYQTGKGTPKQTEEMVKSRVYDANTKINSTYYQYLVGTDLTRYNISFDEQRWLSYGKWLAEPRLSAPFFEPLKILVRQTADSIIASIDDKQHTTLNNLHNIKITSLNLSIYYVLTCLNSPVCTFYFQSKVGEKDRVFAEVKIVDLEQIPVRKINFTTPADERARLVGELQAAYRAGDSAGVLASVAVLLPAQSAVGNQPSANEKSDVVHDLLAYLAEEMIRLNKEKRAVQREFTGWLIGTLKVIPGKDGKTGIEALTGKGRLADFLGDYQKNEAALSETELFDILTKNRARLGVKPEGTTAEAIRRRYAEAVGRGLPLKERLAATDKLIDAIVYRLYGLSEAEIAVVEGRSD
jgi:hypothetical protein